jgi:glucosyl-dolichyl phosphate glucuronosyltransferase
VTRQDRSGEAGARAGSSAGALRASVIVCTHNGAGLIEETLETLVDQDFPSLAFEIVVVDNASSDATPAVLRMMSERYAGRIRVVREPVLGLSHARNRGIRAAHAEVIAFTDDDARVSPRWLRALVEACERPEVACAGGPVHARLEGPLPAWLTSSFLGYLSVFDKGPEEVELPYNDCPRGMNIAFPRQSFQAVGLFSTAFGRKGRSLLSNEEVELCYRLERLGRRILYIPGAVVHHVIHPGRLTVDWFQRRFYWQGKSEAYFDLVHRGHGFVVKRLMQFTRATIAQRVHRGRAGAAPLDRHYITWTSVGYSVGAVHGWMTRIASRGRPASYDGRIRRAS